VESHQIQGERGSDHEKQQQDDSVSDSHMRFLFGGLADHPRWWPGDFLQLRPPEMEAEGVVVELLEVLHVSALRGDRQLVANRAQNEPQGGGLWPVGLSELPASDGRARDAGAPADRRQIVFAVLDEQHRPQHQRVEILRLYSAARLGIELTGAMLLSFTILATGYPFLSLGSTGPYGKSRTSRRMFDEIVLPRRRMW
jgi:hypothetical protein